jgi:hypothetical protein
MDALVNSSKVEVNRERVGRRWYVARLLTALFGACGFGLQLDQVIRDIHAGPRARWGDHIALGAIFLSIAVVHSHLLLSKIRKNQEA